MTRQLPDVPDGWKLVPVEPTLEMVVAGGECPQMELVTGVLSLHQARGYPIKLGRNASESALAEAYRAMLAVSPSLRTKEGPAE